MSRRSQYRAYLLAKGLTPVQADGVLLNIEDESGFRDDAVGDSGQSYGLFQHHGPRRDALFKYSGTRTPNWRQQIDYALTEPDMRNYLAQDYSNPGEAGVAFLRGFERPAEQYARKRAAKYMSRYGGPPAVDVRTAGVGAMPGEMTTGSTNPASVTGDPMTGLIDPQLAASLGMLPQQQPQQPGFAESFARGIVSDPFVAMGAGILSRPQGALGNPMAGISQGVLAGQEAMRQQQLLDQEMQATAKTSGIERLPPNIKELLILKKLYPHLPEAQLLSMAFTGSVKGGGTEFQKIGDRIYRVDRDSFGNPTMNPLSDKAQREYQDVIQEQEQAKQTGTKFGTAHVDTVANTSSAYTKAVAQRQRTEDMLQRFESGEFNNASGPISGRLGQFFSPETAQLQAQEMNETLQNLQITNLAPVSNYEIGLIQKMWASSFNTPKQNTAVLRDLVRLQTAKEEALKKALNRLKTESIEEYLLNPTTIEIPPGVNLDTQTAPPSSAPAGAPGYNPQDTRQEVMDLLNG